MLIEEIGLERTAYWGLMRLGDEQFNRILELGEVPHCIVSGK